MSDELTEEEKALLAAEDAKDAGDDTPEVPAPAIEEDRPRRRGRPRKETEEPVVDVDNDANADTAPAERPVGPNPVQWDGDPWGTTPVQMRNG